MVRQKRIVCDLFFLVSSIIGAAAVSECLLRLINPQETLSALASSDLERFAIKNDGHPTEEAIGLAGERIWDWLKPRLVADLP